MKHLGLDELAGGYVPNFHNMSKYFAPTSAILEVFRFNMNQHFKSDKRYKNIRELDVHLNGVYQQYKANWYR